MNIAFDEFHTPDLQACPLDSLQHADETEKGEHYE